MYEENLLWLTVAAKELSNKGEEALMNHFEKIHFKILLVLPSNFWRYFVA